MTYQLFCDVCEDYEEHFLLMINFGIIQIYCRKCGTLVDYKRDCSDEERVL
jgi:hypothetical protein